MEHQARLGGAFQSCEDVLTAYFEIWNLLLRLQGPEALNDGTAPILDDVMAAVTSALLREQLAIQCIYETRNAGNVQSLWVHVANALETDMDTACKMLEIIPEVWSSQKSKAISFNLCNLYLGICTLIRDSTARKLALTNLKELMDDVLGQGLSMAGLLPSSKALKELWEDIEAEDMNPGLSHVTLAVSGNIMATFVARKEPETEKMLSTWGDMLADAVAVDNVSTRNSLQLTLPY